MSKAETKNTQGFTAEEKAAMKERAKELKAEARASKNKADGERDVLSKIEEMPELEGAIAKRIHEIITVTAPDLMPRTWYGMPAYARDGKIVCFFQGASKFESRYSTLGFNDAANIDDGAMWPTAYAVIEMNPTVEETIRALVAKAVS